jgi:cytochrome bd ubiquinol oxidase subunit II
MISAWFILLAIIVVAYAVLDGFDLGVGVVQLLVGKTNEERDATLSAIGPVWGANEVCLVAAGAVLYAAFPILFATSLAGYYLPIMILLWLLVLRGISLEFRSHLKENVWRSAFDAVFAFSSILLTFVLGVALANVLRGVPLDAQGNFFEPLWTNFRASGKTGVLDWYTILTGLTALVTLGLHGASYLAARTEGELRDRSRNLAMRLWPLVLVFTAGSLIGTLTMLPRDVVQQKLAWGWIFPILAMLALMQFWRSSRNRRNFQAFLYSASYIAIILAGAAYASYPIVLRSTIDPAYSLTIRNAAADAYGLRLGVWWLPFGVAIAVASFIYVFRTFRGPIAVYRPDFPVSVEAAAAEDQASSE